MCGLCGYVGIKEEGLLESMTEALRHRGPDSVGYFKADGVGLGHRRLSIIDVAGGHQPMENEDGSLVLVYNGEIYNYQPLREELLRRGHIFRTKSDSEVILHLYEESGPECLQRLNGIFAIAIYDKKKRQLFLARDRFGVKPLYYLHLPGRCFLFASEFKSILRYKGFEPTLNPQAIHEYLTLRYVPGPGGMFTELRKLPAAHYAIVQNGQVTLKQYWQPELFGGPFKGTEEEYLEGFAEHFERSVRMQLISEVPLGVYLSGGLDSSAITAVTARLVSKPVRTFTVGFNYEHDELAEAAETARLLGCEHTEIACRISDIELLPKIIYHLDEPIGDPIVIPMYQLAREAKRQVTVILAGEGADEILGGYLFHKALLAGHQMTRIIPGPIRRALLPPVLSMIPAGLLNLAFSYPASLGRRGKLKVLDFLNLLEPWQLPEAYSHLISLFDARDTVELYTEDFKKSIPFFPKTPDRAKPFSERDLEVLDSPAPYLNRIIHLQFSHWLPDDILMKQDKMSMAHGIEARVPFLDHELVEYVLRLPPWLKIRLGKSKYILRQYARRILPKKITSRRKMPFYVPIEKYFSEPKFQELMYDTLSERSIRIRGILRPEAVSKLRQAMHRGEFVFVKQVFSLIVLELWFRIAVDRQGST
ncbi:MAG TPA: asparagine synthase (glutamine-hydrolyzing) [Candidatus Limnocylindrales bacterium]|nr:asparagine synthase (glutamine-hydrolyzing) [Candidatus Limnocylindrales bacterium]